MDEVRTSGRVPQAATLDPAPPVTSHSLADLFHAHYDFVWRSLRRLGLGPADADDGAQEVFLVVQRRLADIEAGRERAFLFGTAMRVVSGRRRTMARRRDQPGATDLPDVGGAEPDPAAELQRRQERAVLDEILGEMPLEVRVVFVLFELEGMTMAQIASDHDIAPGTVASRLRRARELFAAASARIQARARRAEDGGA